MTCFYVSLVDIPILINHALTYIRWKTAENQNKIMGVLLKYC